MGQRHRDKGNPPFHGFLLPHQIDAQKELQTRMFRNLVRWFSQSYYVMFEGSATMPSLRKSFGTRLRSIRRARDLSQEHFAEVLGVSVDFLSLIERGINSPSFNTLEQIATRLRVPVKDLFDFPQKRPSK